MQGFASHSGLSSIIELLALLDAGKHGGEIALHRSISCTNDVQAVSNTVAHAGEIISQVGPDRTDAFRE